MPGFLTVVWAPTVGRLALAMVVVAVIVWLCVRVAGRHDPDGPDDADDDDGGGGGPPRPQPPRPPAPGSWSDFERQFAAYVAADHGDERLQASGNARQLDALARR